VMGRSGKFFTHKARFTNCGAIYKNIHRRSEMSKRRDNCKTAAAHIPAFLPRLLPRLHFSSLVPQ
jgi:hypothetical protein